MRKLKYICFSGIVITTKNKSNSMAGTMRVKANLSGTFATCAFFMAVFNLPGPVTYSDAASLPGPTLVMKTKNKKASPNQGIDPGSVAPHSPMTCVLDHSARTYILSWC